VNYLGRPAQNGEEQFWVSLLLQGQTEESVLSQILAGPEFYVHAQTLGLSGDADHQFAGALYLLLLNRTGSSADVDGWAGVLPALGRQGVALGLLTSHEFRTDDFEGYYNALLHRPSNPGNLDPNGLHGWVFSNLDVGAVRTGFEASPEFLTNG